MKLSDFSLLKENDQHYEIGHPKGKALKVPKEGLSRKAHELIKKLKVQHLDEGGDVQPQSDSVQDSPNQIAQDAQAQSAPGITADQEQAAGGGTQAAQVPQTAPVQAPSAYPDSAQALQDESTAIKAGAKAEGVAGNTEAKLQTDYANQESQMPTPDQILSKHQAADQALQAAFMSKTLDPDRYINNMSTGSKVASAIGMILGGGGAGLTHGPNLAVQQLNSAIDRDIESQKNDQSKVMNAWKMNREATGDEMQANLATRNQMLNVVKAKMMAAASGAQSAQAAARIAPVISQINQELQMNNYKRTLMNGQTTGTFNNTDPAQLVPFMNRDPAVQKEMYSEIGRAQNISNNSQKLRELFDQASKDATLVKTMGGLREPGSVMELKQLMLPNFKNVDGTVRQAAMDESFNNIIPRGGDLSDKTAHRKEALENWMHSETAAPVSKGNGIDLQRFKSTTASPAANIDPQKQQYLQWAQAHPNDPRSALVLQKLGVK